LATTSAPDLLRRRPLPAHWMCFPVGHYLRTGAAPSVGQYLRRAATPTIDHGRSRYAKPILFAQSFPSSSSSMEPIVGLYSPSCQQPTSHQSPASQKYFCLTTILYQPPGTAYRTRSGHTHRERGGVRKSNTYSLLVPFAMDYCMVWSHSVSALWTAFQQIVDALL